MQRHAFRAMGTEIELFLDTEEPTAAVLSAEAEFHRLEALFSRFRADSELSRLNETGEIRVGADLVYVVERALAARERTGGRFDPTVHDALVAAGYDRSFENVPRVGNGVVAAARCGGAVSLERDWIALEPGVKLDLGGIGKGYATECAATILGAAGPCLVNAGGDLTIRGGSWPVGLETADGSLTLQLNAGSVATSGRDRRQWRRDGRELHHLIDPSMGSPAETDLLRVTVVAAEAVEAEVWAKALFLAGEQPAAAEADELRLPTVLVTRDGRTRFAGGLA
jgi:FAD:protein FMN transferase